jgi:hypothetical protein
MAGSPLYARRDILSRNVSRPRKARVLFGLSDVVLVARHLRRLPDAAILNLERIFYLRDQKALVLGFAVLVGGDRGVAGACEKLTPAIRHDPPDSHGSV